MTPADYLRLTYEWYQGLFVSVVGSAESRIMQMVDLIDGLEHDHWSIDYAKVFDYWPEDDGFSSHSIAIYHIEMGGR